MQKDKKMTSKIRKQVSGKQEVKCQPEMSGSLQ